MDLFNEKWIEWRVLKTDEISEKNWGNQNWGTFKFLCTKVKL